MPARLKDWAPISFVDHVLAKHPAPTSAETGEPLWEGGIRLHGSQRLIMASDYRYKQARGGIRAGKSFIGAVAIYIDYLWWVTVRGRERALWWLVGPDYEQTKEEMRHLSRLFSEAGIPHKMTTPERDSWTITFIQHPEIEIVTKSGKDPQKIAGRPPRGVVMTEAGQQLHETWLSCFMRVSEARGWVLMTGTFENSQAWYYELAEGWKEENADATGVSYAMPSWDNPIVFPEGRNDPEIKNAETTLPPAIFHEKYGGEPQAPSNLVLPQAKYAYHVGHRYPALGMSFDPEEPVHLAIDPGAAHAYAVHAIQTWKNVAWVIDSVYRWGREAGQIIDECLAKPWAKNVEMGVMDVAGEQQSSTGQPNKKQWQARWQEKTGRQLYIVTQRVPLAIGYQIHQRALLNSWPEAEAKKMFDPTRAIPQVTNPEGPRLMFAPEAATPMFGGVVDGRMYRGEYRLHHNPRRRDGSIARDVPVDEDNDAIKALNYYLFWLFGVQGKVRSLFDPGKTFLAWEVELPA